MRIPKRISWVALSFFASAGTAWAVCNAGAPLVTDAGIPAQCVDGNIPGDDPIQRCHAIAALLGTAYTGDVQGVKVEPPTNLAGDPTVTLTGGKFLAWQSFDIEILSFLLKGGPNTNLYDYEGSGVVIDGNLHSALTTGPRPQIPDIGHYHFCYYPAAAEEEGCTPGYWRNHADRWVGVSPGDDFDTTFGVDIFDPNITLGQAIWLGGGGLNALARHATAALLNSLGGVPNPDGCEEGEGESVDYAYSAAQILQMVQEAIANGTVEETKDLLEAANEAGCPLACTAACSEANPAACI